MLLGKFPSPLLQLLAWGRTVSSLSLLSPLWIQLLFLFYKFCQKEKLLIEPIDAEHALTTSKLFKNLRDDLMFRFFTHEKSCAPPLTLADYPAWWSGIFPMSCGLERWKRGGVRGKQGRAGYSLEVVKQGNCSRESHTYW